MALGPSPFDFMVSQLNLLRETNRGRCPQSRPPDFPALYLGQEKNRCPALTDDSGTNLRRSLSGTSAACVVERRGSERSRMRERADSDSSEPGMASEIKLDDSAGAVPYI